jgi:succinyl-diaminopimelate desuccinylase
MAPKTIEDLLTRLVRFPTVTKDLQANHQALDFIADFLSKRGMYIERFDAYGFESLIATITPSHKTPTVMLSAHLDVVPAAEELFDPRIDDNRIYGRGVLDMKFAIASYLALVDEWQDSLTDYDFGIMITTDEENAGSSVKYLLEEGYQPKVCIIPDGGDDWQLQLTSRAFNHIRLRTFGKQAHGSRPWLGENAILPLTDALSEIRQLFGENIPQASTLNIGTIKGGDAINQVPDYAEASLDIRSKGTEMQLLSPKIRAICQKYNVEYTVIVDGLATDFKLDNPYIAPFVRQIKAITGIDVIGSHTYGSNDTRFFTAYNIPCISLYITGGGHHGPEEWISRQALAQFKEVLGNYLTEVAPTSRM